MNTVDVLKYGHYTVQQAVNDLPDSGWEKAGACGVWSIKDIIAHLTSFEQILKEVLTDIIESEAHTSTPSAATPHLTKLVETGAQFNDTEVDARKGKTVMEILAEYHDTHLQVMSLITQVPDETRRQTGTLPWYGVEYALDDFIVYAFYGHKREHCGQIALFRDRL
ncbi:MAG: maleylpyruvate isomerase N-terminal domain-containing protein [Chloroflexota bacterium]|nr:maleylpyruvate isomerase N-terminal domain-containing protein [Chloroflexota bacterium]